MKFAVFLFILLAPSALLAQSAPAALATAKGHTFTKDSLSPQGQHILENRDRIIADTRSKLLSETIISMLLEADSKAAGVPAEKLIEAQRAKLAAPTAEQIKAVFDANREALAGRTLDDVRPEIISHIRHEQEEKHLGEYLESLKAKHKVTVGRDINTPGLKPMEVVAIVGGRTLTLQEFEHANKIQLADAEGELYEELRADLTASVFSALVAAEAASRNIDSSALIAAEITDKMRSFAPGEREQLEYALRKQLFAKYDVKFLMQEPNLTAHTISTENEPSVGHPSAPVTVVMFTDFQCPACAATHPILKQVLAEYGDKVRLVVRDFPLQTIHANALEAAMAANAAHAQGKFSEFAEKLYANQANLDKPFLEKYAAEAGLNVKKFAIDSADARTRDEILADVAEGQKLGIGGTPAIFVNGKKVYRISADSFRTAIDRALKK